MTTIYFVRHAEPDFTIHEDRIRPLTGKGLADRILVSEFLADKDIQVVLSSPYLRSVDTVKDFADKNNLTVKMVEDFRERKVDSIWIEDFNSFTKSQWEDFDYKLSDGECLREVQTRNIRAVEEALNGYEGKNIVIGTHGTALSTIIHYYQNTYSYEDFNRMKGIMPWVVKMRFEKTECISITPVNILEEARA